MNVDGRMRETGFQEKDRTGSSAFAARARVVLPMAESGLAILVSCFRADKAEVM